MMEISLHVHDWWKVILVPWFYLEKCLIDRLVEIFGYDKKPAICFEISRQELVTLMFLLVYVEIGRVVTRNFGVFVM